MYILLVTTAMKVRTPHCELKWEIPTEHIRQEWDLTYFIEVIDNYGNGKLYPDLEEEAPYVVVRVQR